MSSVVSDLAARVFAGDARAIARAISLIEAENPEGVGLIREIYSHTGGGYLVGITGPPGAGKSSLIDCFIAEVRRARQSVGVLAVDPTSPFTGGAMLGDRVRMQSRALDDGVFIRSMATRGHLGGLAGATDDAALVLDAARKDWIVVETVGVGQDEVEIARTADVSIVVLVPGLGDEIQALKAGIMEIADIFVLNKRDREGADRAIAAIEASLALQTFIPGQWRPPIVSTQATTGLGVVELLEQIERFRAHSAPAQAARRRERSAFRLRDIVTARLRQVAESSMSPAEMDKLIDDVAARTLDPYSAADQIVSMTTR